MRRGSVHAWKFLFIAVGMAALGAGFFGQAGQASDSDNHLKDGRMSAMGREAVLARHRAEALAAGVADEFDPRPLDDSLCFNDPRCPGGFREDGPTRAQSEVTIAVDTSGQHVVIGYNDFRGFNFNPISLSGVMYSDDGGQTFVDGGQLPSPGTDTIGTTRYRLRSITQAVRSRAMSTSSTRKQFAGRRRYRDAVADQRMSETGRVRLISL